MTKAQAVDYLKSFTSYEDILKYRYDEAFFNLARFKKFLVDYGVEYGGLSVVHIAGSKGKGTTAHLIAEYLNGGGGSGGGVGLRPKVGLFTSPYILDINECFWVSGKTISDKEFVALVVDVRDFLEGWVCEGKGLYVTYFEILFALVVRWFLKNGVSLAVVEVGLGGRLDATNIFKKPLLTILTRVEKEHVVILGRTYAKILNEKLGIVKRGVPLVVGPQNGVVLKEIARRKLGVPIFYVEDGGEGYNFAVAKTALQILDKKFDESRLVAVASSLRILGRFQIVDGVVFDMAHTPESAKFLRGKLDEKFVGDRFVFLVSLMRDKNVRGFMKALVFGGIGRGKVDAVCFTSSHEVRGFSGKELSGIVTGGFVVEDPVVAFNAIKRNLKRDQVLVVTGSHFLVSKILKQLS